MSSLEKMIRDIHKGDIEEVENDKEDVNPEIKNTEYNVNKLANKINDLDQSDNIHSVIFFAFLVFSLVIIFMGGEELEDAYFTVIAIPSVIYIFYMLIKIQTNATKRNNLNSQMNTLNSSIQTIRTKERIAKLSSKELFEELERHVDNLRIRYSIRREKVVVGYKENEVFGIKTQEPQYSTRTHEVSDKKIEKRIESSTPSNYEKEIIRRANDLLPELVGKYKSGNKSIIKRILNTLPVKKVGKEFEEYEMFQEADEWYSSHQMLDDARKMKEKSKFKIDQTVVHGDYVDDRDTIVKDSVINRSNVGSGSKADELREAKALLDEGLINENDYEKMKKEILGK